MVKNASLFNMIPFVVVVVFFREELRFFTRNNLFTFYFSLMNDLVNTQCNNYL